MSESDQSTPSFVDFECAPFVPSPTSLLSVQGLSAGYGEAVVLSEVSFCIEPGQTLALLGRNGVGKTTLINTLAGATRLHAGEISLGGVRIEQFASFKRVTSLLGGGIGWVPQERNIFKSLTVHENLSSVYRFQTGPKAWSPERVYEFFPRLFERRDNLGSQLSGGEQQMLAVARALVVNPRLLLLDEPLEGLAPIIVEELLKAIRWITREEGLSAIIVEQHPQMILAISDIAIILERGSIVHRENAASLRKNTKTLDHFLGVKR
jgi:branched-chain amino acid transport system ATP-binding protein